MVWTVDKGAHLGGTASGALVGSLLFPGVGTVIGAALGGAGAGMRDPARCTDCGTVYSAENVQLLRQKAVPVAKTPSKDLGIPTAKPWGSVAPASSVSFKNCPSCGIVVSGNSTRCQRCSHDL